MNIEGEKYAIVLAEKLIGHGGNGEVFTVKSITSKSRDAEKLDPKECVVKMLKKQFAPKSEDGEHHERYKRFVKEIKKMMNCQGKISHIMPILDSFTADDKKMRPWYLMRCAKSFGDYQYESVEKKLEYMLTIGETLKNLHDMKMAHRDIKLANLLFLDNEIYLSDFGLIWSADDTSHFTGKYEQLGPIFSAPPEMEKATPKEGMTDYRKSDVYLFAKLVWSCLKNDPRAFRGSYQRTGDFYLSKDPKLKAYPLEPIHLLLEECSQNDMKGRPDMERCIVLIKEELYILKNPNSPEARRYQAKEIDKEIQSQYTPQKKIFTNVNDIMKIIRQKLKKDTLPCSIRGFTCCCKDVQLGPTVEDNMLPSIILKCDRDNNYLCIPDNLEIENLKDGYAYRLHIKESANGITLPGYELLPDPFEIPLKKADATTKGFVLAFKGAIEFS